MNRSKKSILNAIFALLQMGITSIFGLMLSKSVLSYYGSDYNGVNSIATQIVNTIMVLEGGFTLASNVALFKPFISKNIQKINGVLSATSKRFRTVSIMSVAIGLIIAIVFPFCITTQVSYSTCVCLMLTVLLPASFNLGYCMKYRVILLTDQKEYIISAISALFYAFGTGMGVIAIHKGCGLVAARVIIMISMFLGYYCIGVYCKRKYRYIQFKEPPLFNEISGSKNVLALKLTAMLYSSMPIVLISTLPKNGSLLASVYAVYKSVISVVSNSLTSITNAPRLGFGSLLAENDYEKASSAFEVYERIAYIGMAIILGTACLLLMPFVDLYTKGVTDIEYHNVTLASIMLTTVFLEICHVPSGQIVQMSGNFEISRNIQTIACIILLFGMIIGRAFTGLYGILLSVLLAAFVLCTLEVGYTARKIFKRNILKIFVNALPCLLICVIASVIGFSGKIVCENYLVFVVDGIIGVVLLSVIAIFMYFVVDRKTTAKIMSIFFSAIKRER